MKKKECINYGKISVHHAQTSKDEMKWLDLLARQPGLFL